VAAPAAAGALAVEYRPLGSLIAYARNARTHTPEQVAALVGSMREFGWTNPVLVQPSGEIIAGHGRVLAAHEAHVDPVPCIVLSHLSETQVKALRIADNQLAIAGAGWDYDLLRSELGLLRDQGFGLGLLGFPAPDLTAIFARNKFLTDPDAIPVVEPEAVSARGDLWVMDGHRLLCGDSADRLDVRRLMNGQRAGLFSTDPPYVVGYDGTSHPVTSKTGGVGNKNWSRVYHEAGDRALGRTLYDGYTGAAIAEALTPNAAWYCWHSTVGARMVEDVWTAHGAFVHLIIIWVKSRAVLNFSAYRWGHEPCMFGWVDGCEPPVYEFAHEEASMGWVRGAKPTTTTKGLADFGSTVWHVASSEVSSKDHPTSKPIKLFTVPMEVHTRPGALCYEPFSGSGSQIIAAESVARRCYAMEISPHFVDVAVRRWQAFTGGIAVLEGSGQSFAEVASGRVPTAPAEPVRSVRRRRVTA
jgi:DNA modification methylase